MIDKRLIRTNLITVNEENTLSEIQSLFKYQRDLVVLSGQRCVGIINESLAYRLNMDPSTTKVKNLMQRPPKISGEESPEQAAKLMVESGLKLIPVTDASDVYIGGILADDIIKFFLNDLKMINVKNAMTPNPFTIDQDATLGQALSYLRKNNISRLIVMDGNKPVGIVTLHDIIEKVIKPSFRQRRDKMLSDYKRLSDQSIKGIMSTDLKILDASSSVADAFDLMQANSFSSVPIIEKGKLIGIITKEDILKQIALRQESGPVVFVQISKKGNLQEIEIDKNMIVEKVKLLIKRYSKFLENSTITIYIRSNEIKSRGKLFFEVRLQVVGPNYRNSIVGEGFGLRNAINNAINNLERLLQKEKETTPYNEYAFTRILNQILG